MQNTIIRLMKIIIITSSDHIYANYIISRLIKDGVFKGHTVNILEQDSIIPNKSKFAGITRYIRISGWTYFTFQVLKQLLFQAARLKAMVVNDTNSTFYPYFQLRQPNIKVQLFNRIKNEGNQKYITSLRPDLILSILSKEIIPENILKIPKYGCINFHPAPLPNYKGISPTFWVLANGENHFGATLHYINTGIDTGQIIYHNLFTIDTPTSEHKIYLKCAEYAVLQISNLLKKRSLKSISTLPNSSKGSYFSLPTKDAVKQFLAKGNTFFEVSEFTSQ
jgi:folate-dependent phosphoribosylglycinamide formyltransferase PurN